jgi:hypothetical protein
MLVEALARIHEEGCGIFQPSPPHCLADADGPIARCNRTLPAVMPPAAVLLNASEAPDQDPEPQIPLKPLSSPLPDAPRGNRGASLGRKAQGLRDFY